MADPVLWTLAGTTAATVFYLLDRRAKLRPTALDAWAANHQLPLLRDVPTNALAGLEPLALLPTVLSVERLASGTLRSEQLAMTTSMSVCAVGGERQVRRFLLAAFGGHPDLPALRILPAATDDAPRHLGFSEMPATALPAGYRIEAFQPLRTDLVTTIGDALAEADPTRSFRLELRSGRILVAAPHREGSSPEAMMGLGVSLNERLFALLGPPAEVSPDEKAGSCDSKAGGCGPCGCR